jgi:hypothetical protein
MKAKKHNGIVCLERSFIVHISDVLDDPMYIKYVAFMNYVIFYVRTDA